jgi:hypothetical protein
MNQNGRNIRSGLWYDFRNPPRWRQSPERLYGEILDQIAWGEAHGFGDVWLSEHHFIEDGYLHSILTVAAAIAARTSRIRIASVVLLMPFYNPVHLAEDIAVVDVISGGRFELGIGVGYKLEELKSFAVPSKNAGRVQTRLSQSFAVFLVGRPSHSKASSLTSGISRLRRSLFRNLIHLSGWAVSPRQPFAVRCAMAMVSPCPMLRETCTSAISSNSRKATVPATTSDSQAVSNGCPFRFDPEKTFHEAAEHIIYQANNYTAWLSAAGHMPDPVYLQDREQLRRSGLLKVVEPDTAITIIRDFFSNVPVIHYYSWTLPPGLPPRWAQSHLELFAPKVTPAFR